MKNALEARFFCEIPLPPLNFEGNIFVRRSSLEFYDAEVRTLSRLQIVLRSFLFVEQFRIEDVEFVALNCFGRRVIVIVVLRIVLVPLNGNSPSIDVLRFLVPKASFSLAWNPVVELLFVLFQPFVLLKLDDLLSDEVNRYCRVIDNSSTQKIMIFWKGQILFQLLSAFFKLILKYFLGQSVSFGYFLFLCGNHSVIDH